MNDYAYSRYSELCRDRNVKPISQLQWTWCQTNRIVVQPQSDGSTKFFRSLGNKSAASVRQAGSRWLVCDLRYTGRLPPKETVRNNVSSLREAMRLLVR